MTHEEFWSWVYILGTAGLGWPPDVVMNADMSQILLAWEGKALLQKRQQAPEEPPSLAPGMLGGMIGG